MFEAQLEYFPKIRFPIRRGGLQRPRPCSQKLPSCCGVAPCGGRRDGERMGSGCVSVPAKPGAAGGSQGCSAPVGATMRLPEQILKLSFPGSLSISVTFQQDVKRVSLFFLLVFIRYSSDLSYFPQRRKLWFSSTNTASTLKKCQKHSKHMYDPVLV